MAWGSGNILPHCLSGRKDIRDATDCSVFVTKSDSLWDIAALDAYYLPVFCVPEYPEKERR